MASALPTKMAELLSLTARAMLAAPSGQKLMMARMPMAMMLMEMRTSMSVTPGRTRFVAMVAPRSKSQVEFRVELGTAYRPELRPSRVK